MIQERLCCTRGDDRQQPDLFLYGTLEQRSPQNHPLRPVRAMTDAALEALSERFDEIYAAKGRPSIAPERLLRALLRVRPAPTAHMRPPPVRADPLATGHGWDRANPAKTPFNCATFCA
jgi:hypothetical protein